MPRSATVSQRLELEPVKEPLPRFTLVDKLDALDRLAYMDSGKDRERMGSGVRHTSEDGLSSIFYHSRTPDRGRGMSDVLMEVLALACEHKHRCIAIWIGPAEVRVTRAEVAAFMGEE